MMLSSLQELQNIIGVGAGKIKKYGEPFTNVIKEYVEKNNIKTMLDYGCGKGFYYDNSFNSNGLNIKSLRDYWNIDTSYRYHAKLSIP